MQPQSEPQTDFAATNAALEETAPNMRPLNSLAGQLLYWIGVAVSLIHLYLNTFGTMSELWGSALHFGLFGLMAALLFPAAQRWREHSSCLIIDLVVGGLALGCAIYLIFAEVPLYQRGQYFIWSDWVMACLAVGLAMELSRRTTGLIIPVLMLIALTYVAWWGRYLDGVFQFPGLSWETTLFRSYFSTTGMFGTIANISATYVFMFILFGAFLVKSGAGEFIIQLSRVMVGKLVGGPGLVAVVGSAMMGSISGSAIANTVSTGVITIPMMKRAGFPARFAAGTEAAASTGGQLMPPVMGAGAFIMASYTQIPYLDIIAVALLPALLYFLSMMFFVRIEARRQNLITFTDAEQPQLWPVLKQGGYLLIPLIVLVGLLIYGYTPTYAAGFAILSVVVTSWLVPNRRMNVRDILDALALGARNMTGTAVLLVAVGIVINVISTTGIGNTFSLMVTEWSSGSLLIMLVLVALASLVLGMGLPVTAAYIVLGTLSAPALFELITQNHMITAFMHGDVPENAKTLLMLSLTPEQLTLLGQPMSQQMAMDLVATLPPELFSIVRDNMLPAALLSTALLSAHMIIFWLSQDSNVTPPVCLTAFAAAAIAGSSPMRTGVTAWKIAKGLYIMPVLFAYTAFLGNDLTVSLSIFGWAIFGVYALAGVLEGWLEAPISWLERGLLLGAGAALLWPELEWFYRLLGLAVLVGVFMWSKRRAGQVVMASADIA